MEYLSLLCQFGFWKEAFALSEEVIQQKAEMRKHSSSDFNQPFQAIQLLLNARIAGWNDDLETQEKRLRQAIDLLQPLA